MRYVTVKGLADFMLQVRDEFAWLTNYGHSLAFKVISAVFDPLVRNLDLLC